ncbi:MAG: hypothetical protein ACOC56_01655 [Atribacterota bacterium]
MRLKKFLNEDGNIKLLGDDKEKRSLEIIDIIRRNCAPFLKKVGELDNFLYRGSDRIQVMDIAKTYARYNRSPKDMPHELHHILDDEFKKKFGWSARSEGVFAVPSCDTARLYGTEYIFFPIGKFKYLWSKKIQDLFSYIADEINLYGQAQFYENLIDKIKNIVSSYTNKDIKKLLNDSKYERCEIMFKCREYYLVNNEYYDYLNGMTYEKDYNKQKSLF